ncbi:GHKL domain-containing protein [Carnobacterium divergens]|uniref:GHKL domain-containing protein n=1 Tax=Carnobacterium divergens TaxID=2748 RepID=A0AAW8R8X8_CARDV|nr:GHKL domain-containing protein [Carnobacterium divergens]MDT1958392.1 GHKL domain-containing protein [Carnobacterium divergens]MDT1974241.1 GHKL domain-containing protein [Carnobacterium divergens]
MIATIHTLTLLIDAVLINYVFFTKSNSIEENRSIKFNIFILSTIILSLPLRMFLPDPLVPILNLFFSISVMTLISEKYKIPLKNSIFWVFILLVTFLLSEAITFFFINKILQIKNYDQNNILLVTTVTFFTVIIKIFFSLILVNFTRKKITSHIENNVSSLIALTLIPFTSIIILCIFLLVNVNLLTNTNNILINITITIGIFFINICSLYLHFSLSKHYENLIQTQAQNEKLKVELKVIEQLKSSETQLRTMRHDLRNQFVVLLGLIKNNEINQAEKYLNSSLTKLNNTVTFYTNNYILNFLINNKKLIADKYDINFIIDILLPERIKLDNEILAIIVGNLLDNALEASIRVKDNSNKKIELHIKEFKGNVLIEVSNIFDCNEIKTRKKRQSDGLGIQSIQHVINKYNGIYEQWVLNDLYTVSIILLNIYNGVENYEKE